MPPNRPQKDGLDQRLWSFGRHISISLSPKKNMASWSTWQSLVHNSSGPWFEPRTCQNKNVVFSPRFEPRTLHNNKTSFQAASLYSSTIFFLSLPRPSLKKKRTVDARGVRGIWIYAAKKDHKPWSRPSFCGLSAAQGRRRDHPA